MLVSKSDGVWTAEMVGVYVEQVEVQVAQLVVCGDQRRNDREDDGLNDRSMSVRRTVLCAGERANEPWCQPDRALQLQRRCAALRAARKALSRPARTGGGG